VPGLRCRAGPPESAAGGPQGHPGAPPSCASTVEKATLFPSPRRSQKTRQFGRSTDKCLVLDIFKVQLVSFWYDYYKNVLLATVKSIELAAPRRVFTQPPIRTRRRRLCEAHQTDSFLLFCGGRETLNKVQLCAAGVQSLSLMLLKRNNSRDSPPRFDCNFG
jgi:hypothetical protein